jgi:Tfp pilus assembly protein PilF
MHPQSASEIGSIVAAGRSWQDILPRLAILALAVLWIYSPVCNPTLQAEWLWDDDTLLTANLTVQHRLSSDPAVPPAHAATLGKLWLAPSGPDYFPLTYTALWAQWPFFSMDPRDGGPVKPGGPAVAWPFGYHLVSVLLHLAGALTLWRLFAVMRMPGAWLGALIFAVHPVAVESVAWVSELKNTLSLPLFLLAAINYIHFDNMMAEGEALDSPRAARRYVLALVFFLLAMLAKTSVVMFPVLILFYVWWKRGRVTGRDVVRSGHFFLVSLVLGLVTIYFQHSRAIGDEPIIVGGFASRLACAGMSVFWYLKLLVWPVHLLPIYPRWDVDPPKLWQFLPWLIIAAAGAWFWWKRASWGRHAIFAFGSFLLMLAPVLGFITMSYMRITWAADHFIYLPIICLVGWVAAGIARWYERAADEKRRVIFAGTTAAMIALTILSFKYAACWVNEDALWTHTLTHNENAWQAHNRLGARKSSRGQFENSGPANRIENLGAFHHFTRATELRPDLGETHNNLATVYREKARASEQRGDDVTAKREMNASIHHFAEACRLTPQVTIFQVNLANVLMTDGRNAEAANKYKELVEKEPNNPSLISNYGVVLFKQGNKMEEAVAQFRRALEIAPDLKDAREGLAAALGEIPDLAAKTPLLPPEGKPGDPKYEKFIADSMAVAGRIIEAEGKYKELLSKDPNNPTLVNNYGSILYNQGKNKEAIAQFRRALELAPDLKDASINLAVALAEKPAPSADTSPPPPGEKPQPAKSDVPAKKNPVPK